ncbi:MAG: AMP-binding protein [Betaproteobacteria bacterium]
MLTLPSMLERTARMHGGNIAIRDAESDLDWRAYVARSARAAGMLQDLGLRRGERFAILSRNSARYAELLHAAYWLGVVPVPLNFRLAPAEIAQVLEDSGCRVVAVEEPYATQLALAPLDAWRSRAFCLGAVSGAGLPCYDALRDAARALDPNDPDEADDAILLYTGGTTGRGKGVRLSHRNVMCNALQLARTMSVTQADRYLHVSAMFHSTDLKATAVSLHGGGHAYIPEFTPRAVLGAIRDYRITIGSLVPTMIIRMLRDASLEEFDLATLRLISYGTSPMPAEWIRRTMQAFPGVDMHQVYGLTETSPVLAILDEDDHRRALAGREDLLHAGGRALPGLDVRIVDGDGRDVARGISGEIVVRGPQVSCGYHNRPEENAAVFRGGWFHTGDVGRLDDEGYIFVQDRKKDMVVTGGENVYTSEVEAVICRHPDVVEVAVVGVPDERFGEALCAVIVPAPGKRPAAEDVIAHCRAHIGGYKIPRRISLVDALPKSAMGKVLKEELRRQMRAQPTKETVP